MVTAITPNPAAETNRSGGRATRGSEGQVGARSAADVAPKKPSKALTAALKKRDMMIRAGAPAASVAVMDARIERLTPKSAPAAVVAEGDSLAKLQSLLDVRITLVTEKRARVEALRAELAAAEADLDTTIARCLTTPLIENLEGSAEPETTTGQVVSTSPAAVEEVNPFTVAKERAEQEAAEHRAAHEGAVEVLGDGFAAYEPKHVLTVARGARPRWVRGDDGGWYIAARAVDTMEGVWVEVERADGSTSVEKISGSVAVARVDGDWVAVLTVARDIELVEVAA